MNYEKTGSKVNKDSAKSASDYELKAHGTGEMLWHIVKRHKFGLVSTYAVLITIDYIFPPAKDLIFSMI